MLKCRMVKGPLRLKDQYTLIEQSAHLALLKMSFTNTIQLYNYLIISPAIAVHDAYIYIYIYIYIYM